MQSGNNTVVVKLLSGKTSPVKALLDLNPETATAQDVRKLLLAGTFTLEGGKPALATDTEWAKANAQNGKLMYGVATLEGTKLLSASGVQPGFVITLNPTPEFLAHQKAEAEAKVTAAATNKAAAISSLGPNPLDSVSKSVEKLFGNGCRNLCWLSPSFLLTGETGWGREEIEDEEGKVVEKRIEVPLGKKRAAVGDFQVPPTPRIVPAVTCVSGNASYVVGCFHHAAAVHPLTIDEHILIWNFTSRALVHHITLHSVNPSSGHVEEILWLNDHTVLLRSDDLTSPHQPTAVRTLDLQKGQLLHRFEHKSAVTSMLLKDSSVLITTTADLTLKVWNVKDATLQREISLPSGIQLTACKLTADCSAVVVSSFDHVYVVDVASGEVRKKIALESRTAHLVHVRGDIALVKTDARVLLCNLGSGAVSPVNDIRHTYPLRIHGDRIYTWESDLPFVFVYRWNADNTIASLGRFELPPSQPNLRLFIECIAESADGKYVAATLQPDVHVWKLH